jgi:hypothetical protein
MRYKFFLCCVAGYLWLFAIGAPTSAQEMTRNIHGTVDTDYESAAELCIKCRKNGIQGSQIDFLICAAAKQLDVPIFTTDKDFAHYHFYFPKFHYSTIPLGLKHITIGGSKPGPLARIPYFFYPRPYSFSNSSTISLNVSATPSGNGCG